MIAEKIVVPKFATEREEADWWYDNREEHGEIMAKAMEEGRTKPMREFLAERGIELPKTVPVQLDLADVDLARRQAAARGIDPQSYLQKLVHQALTETT